MAPTIYFGVELDFCLGYILPGTANPVPASTRMLDFSVSEDTISEVLETTATRPTDGSALESPLTREQLLFPSSLVISAVREHIGQALSGDGLPFALESDSLGVLDKWAIGTDTSVGAIQGTDPRYLWCAAEITSPAYLFNTTSLRAVKKVCDILSTKYLTKVNNSCGLHVHISFCVFPEKEAFEPQFDTMHPSSRLGTSWIVRSMWIYLVLASDLGVERVLPNLLLRQGLERIHATQDLPELTRLVSRKRNERNMTVSMYHFTQWLYPGSLSDAKGVRGKIKPTVEFRQHEGTLDGERVVKWIETVVGVISWLEERDVDPKRLMELVRECQERAQERRVQNRVFDEDEWPVRRDGEISFTVIEVLENLSFHEQARFYGTILFGIASKKNKE